MIDLYFWPTGNGYKIAIMLEECELDYQIKEINIGKGDQFDPDFLKISPNNKMPAIVDPDGPDGAPISVFESGAILQYLARKTGKFCGSTERNRTEVDQWLFWQVGGLGPMAGQAHHFLNYSPEFVEYAAHRYANETHRLYGVLNKQLEGKDYICGDFSIADMAAFPWVRRWEWQGIDMDDHPNIKAWYDRVESRPKTAKALTVMADTAPPLGPPKNSKYNFKRKS